MTTLCKLRRWITYLNCLFLFVLLVISSWFLNKFQFNVWKYCNFVHTLMTISCTNYNIILNVLVASMCTFTSASDSSYTPFIFKQTEMGLSIIFEINYVPFAYIKFTTPNISVVWVNLTPTMDTQMRFWQRKQTLSLHSGKSDPNMQVYCLKFRTSKVACSNHHINGSSKTAATQKRWTTKRA